MMAISGNDGDKDIESAGLDGVAPVEETVAEDRLGLDDDDEQLPWLESPEDYDQEGPDSGRILGFALIGLLALAAIVGGIWWASNRGESSMVVADGSTIEAPDAPYKSKPEDPGGKTFAGTGDTSFKVGEGKVSDGQIASDTAPKPGIDRDQVGAKAGAKTGSDAKSDTAGKLAVKPATVPKPKPSATPETASGSVPVQVGAYSNKSAAEAGWNTLYGRHEALKGVKYRIVEGQADIGTVYRLQAMAGSAAAANSLCSALKADGAACQVKR